MENRKTVVLQSHMDMVCEKNRDVEFDFEKDAIQTYVDGEWMRAKGTTLGADDGIGVAMQMAVLASDDIQHGPIECLFTRDEETGLSGAFALEAGFMSGDILINLDSEDERKILPEINRFELEGADVMIKHIGGYPGKYDQQVKKIINTAAPNLLICGHSHILKVKYDRDYELLNINPGAAGKYGFHTVRTLVRFNIDNCKFSDLEVIELKD